MSNSTRIYLADTLPGLLVPVRMDVFATRPMLKRKRGKPVDVACAWQGWNADTRMEQQMARLKGAGSFYWQGAIQALVAAKRTMRDDVSVQQIKLETISGREIARLYR